MKNKWPKRAPALLAAVALTASMFPTGALALEAERQDTAETVFHLNYFSNRLLLKFCKACFLSLSRMRNEML